MVISQVHWRQGAKSLGWWFKKMVEPCMYSPTSLYRGSALTSRKLHGTVGKTMENPSWHGFGSRVFLALSMAKIGPKSGKHQVRVENDVVSMGLWGGWKGVYPVRENPSWDGIPTTDHLLEEAIMVSLTQRPSSNWLVVEPYPSEKWWSSSMGRIIYPIYEMEKKSHVWNHQPVDQPVDMSVTCLWSHWSHDQHEVQEIWIHRETYTPLKSADIPRAPDTVAPLLELVKDTFELFITDEHLTKAKACPLKFAM